MEEGKKVKTIVYKEYLREGLPELGKHWVIEESDFDATLKDGEVISKTLFLSVDPYFRGRMVEGGPGYMPGFEMGKPGVGGVVVEVIATKTDQAKVGDKYVGMFSWATYHKFNPADLAKTGLQKLPETGLSPSVALGTLGMPGLTAYFGLLDITNPKEGETLLVSGAAGAVGSVVVQIGKIKGCRVIGIAGSDEKLEYLKTLGADATINYKKTDDMRKALKEAHGGKGIDIYFDNVGGPILDAALDEMNTFGRVSICGAISQYNLKNPRAAQGPRKELTILSKQLRVEGFVIMRWMKDFGKGTMALAGWVKEGKIQVRETVKDGFENFFTIFNAMMTGGNIGKMVVKV